MKNITQHSLEISNTKSNTPDYSNGYFYSLKDYLNNRFDQRVHRITLDAYLDCPNRDGNKAFGGCTFCTADGSSGNNYSIGNPIKKQLYDGVEVFSKRFKAQKFISYLQSFTNTYASTEKLKVIYDEAISHPDVVALAIGTRPDCLSEEVLDLIENYSTKVEVWIDMGLQTIHNKTLDSINRAHTSEDFFDAVNRCKKRNLIVCGHTIFGLPGEDENMFYETMNAVSKCNLDAIKIHQLLVLEKTKMEAQYKNGEIKTLEQDHYINLVCDFLEILNPNIVIHRLFAEAKPHELVSPLWAAKDNGGRNKQDLLNKILREFERRKTKQGSKFQASSR